MYKILNKIFKFFRIRVYIKKKSNSNKSSYSSYRPNYDSNNDSSKTYDPFNKSNFTNTRSTFISTIIIKMINDFNNFPYQDKIKINDFKKTITYFFESNNFIIVDYINYTLKEIYYDKYEKKKGKISNLTSSEISKIVDILSDFPKKFIKRPKNSSDFEDIFDNFEDYFGSNFKNKFDNHFKNKNPFTQQVSKYTPEQLKYQKTYSKLKDVYDGRVRQINKLKKSDSERENIINEMNVIEKKIDLIKPKTGL